MPTPEVIAEDFRRLDFHDDTLIGLEVFPTQAGVENTNSIVEIRLRQHSENKLRLVRFFGCANLRVAVDFDVLASNFPSNTSRVDAYTNPGRMRDLMESQKRDWDVQYSGTSISPLTAKLAVLNELVFFRVQFFGGAVDLVAREYNVETNSET